LTVEMVGVSRAKLVELKERKEGATLALELKDAPSSTRAAEGTATPNLVAVEGNPDLVIPRSRSGDLAGRLGATA